MSVRGAYQSSGSAAAIAIGEQAERVEDDQQGRSFMQGDRRSDAETKDGGWHQEGDDAEAHDEVLANDAARPAAEFHCEGELGQVVRHEGDVGRLERDVRTRGAHGYADRRRGHGGSVIDPVAHHRDLGVSAQAFLSAAFLACEGRPGYVLHLVVQKTRQVIKSTDGTPYVRRGAQKLPVRGEDALRRLELDKGVATFEDETVKAPLDLVTNSVTVIEFMLAEVPAADPERWLRSQLLIDGDKPTVSGALLFADEPQAILPKRSAIKIFRYKTVEEDLDRDAMVDAPLTVEGPLYDIIVEAVATTKEIVEGIKKLGEGGLEAISYPDETLHEIITNSVLHRDYSIATDIQIRIYDDRIEVHSPGRLPGHVTVDNLLDEQFARNPKLVRLINKFPNPPNKDVGEGLNTVTCL